MKIFLFPLIISQGVRYFTPSDATKVSRVRSRWRQNKPHISAGSFSPVNVVLFGIDILHRQGVAFVGNGIPKRVRMCCRNGRLIAGGTNCIDIGNCANGNRLV
jgi:hypothetical protein